jgi:hypothetical protein
MKKLIIFTLAITLVGINWSCKDALEIEPRQSIDATTALTSRDGISAAIVSIYARLKNLRVYGRDNIALPEALADNGFATNKSGRLLNEYNNVQGAHFTGGLWQVSYAAINQANLILEAIPAATDPTITQADRTSWEAQLFFLRALYHFDLVKAFAYIPGAEVAANNRGGIPIMLTGTKTSDDALLLKPSRAPIADVYAQIIKDLEAANARFTGTTGLPSNANKPATQALLSRVHLYAKNYTDAKRWADSAIATVGGRLTNSTTYVTNWRNATHNETLFQVAFFTNAESPGVNESLQTSFTTLAAPGGTTTTGFGDLVPTISLLNALGITMTGGNNTTVFGVNVSIASRTADVRNQLYEVGTTGRGPSKIECTKFIGKNGFPNLDNTPVIRVAELYLNRAEAMATPNSPVFNATAALADLNAIVTNRGLPAFTGLTGSALYEEILNQRRIEFAFEGHRFWDLKRLGRDIVKAPHSPNVLPIFDTRILAPIPQREIDGNKNLVQNPGY